MRIQDIADILIMTILVYQLYIWFRKSRALQVVLGLGSLVLLYIVTKNMGLFMTSWVLQELGTVIFVLIIVVFQGEIRQALYRFSMLRNFFNRNEEPFSLDIQGIVSTLFSLAEHRTGAIVVFERQEKLDDHLLHGVQLDSLFSSQLLASIFEGASPLHDGAVIIRNSRISEASSHLPLSLSSELPQYLGTRHRAALGITEKTDAVVLVVSEERGEVSLAFGGELVIVRSPEELRRLLETSLVTRHTDLPGFSLRQRLLKNLLPKLVTFFLIVACWLLINAGQSGGQVVTAMLKFHNLPENLILKSDIPAEVEVQLKVLSTLFTGSKKFEISADVDLSKVHEGMNSIPVEAKAFRLPLGVSVVKVAPSVLRIVAEEKKYRELPVYLKRRGRLPHGLRLKSVAIEPSTVMVEGAESVLAYLSQISTEPVDLSKITGNRVLEVKLLPPSPQVRLRSGDSVKARIVVIR